MSSNKKTAFVHDRLFHYWWAWIVLSQLISKYKTNHSRLYVLFSPFSTFDECQVVTALPHKLNTLIAQSQTSKRKIIRRLFDYRNLMPLYPILVWLLRQKIKKYSPDHLVVSSFAAVKNVQRWNIAAKSTLYLHSPMQYIRENYSEYCQKLSGLKKIIFISVSWYLRKRDKKPVNYETIYTNSYYTAQCAKKLYNRTQSTVLYPSLPTAYRKSSPIAQPHDYYIYIWRLVTFVRETDRIIHLCNELSLPLLIVWTWPDEAYLQSIAGPTITFLWLIKDEETKIKLLTQSKWLINLSKESLWIVTMEALATGTPVLWYNAWWTQELVRSPNRWIVAEDKSFETLEKAVQRFIIQTFDRENIQQEFWNYYDSVGSII